MLRECLVEVNSEQDVPRKKNMADQIEKTPRILRRKQVEQRIGLARSSLYALIAAGAFPKQIKLSTRAVGWRESEIDAWIASRAVAAQ
jgi:prophage regulatory protein